MSISREQFDRVISPIEHQMMNAVWHVLGDAHDAEDALQDAVIIILKRWRRVTRHKNPPALILKMCVDCAYDHLRRKIRITYRRQDLETLDGPSDMSDPADGLSKAELRDQIMRAVSQLPRKQAIAFLLRIAEEQSYEEVAESLDCSVATARKHVARARRRLSVLLHQLAPRSGAML